MIKCFGTRVTKYLAILQCSIRNFISQELGAILVLLMAAPALAATMAQPAKPDPLLDGGPTVPCAASPDYAGGIDVHGRPVAAADEGAQPVPVPDAIAVPLAHAAPGARLRPAPSGDSAYVMLDGKRLDPLVNPPPCR